MDVSANEAIAAVFRLPSDLRVELASDLLQSVARENEGAPPALTEQQKAEIERRFAEAKANPEILISEEEFWDRVQSRHAE